MQKFNTILQMISKRIFQAFYYVATVLFAILLVLLFYNVIARNLLGGSHAWIDEITKYFFVWMMFLGISIGVYHKKHLGVEFLVTKLPQKVQYAFEIFTTLLTILFFGVLVFHGFRYVQSTLSMLSPVLGISYGLVYACVPVSSILCIFYCVARLADDFCRKEEGQ